MPAMDLGPAGQRVANNVGALRERRGMSLRQLSAALGRIGRPILPSGIIKAENGTRRVDAADLIALALVLGVTPNRLMLSADHNSETVELSVGVETTANGAWRWACGEHVIRPGVRGAPPLRDVLDFMVENRPHAAGQDLSAQLGEHRVALAPFVRAARSALDAGVPPSVLMHALVIADTIGVDALGTPDGDDGAD